MEEVTTPNDTTLATVTSKVKVLTIGDQEECSTTEKSRTKYDRNNFQADCSKRLGLLLVGTTSPMDFVNDWNLVEYFAAGVVKHDKKPEQYHFYCSVGQSHENGILISGPTFNARAVMDQVRKRLKGENWISENAIEMPFRTKVPKFKYYYRHQHIQQIVSDALGAESTRLFQFLYHLHKEYIRNRKN